MITFSGNPLDRTAARRDDEAWLAERRANGRVLALHEGKPLMRGDELAWLDGAGNNALFLGMDGETAVFAVETDDARDGEFRELRAVALLLPADEAAIVAAAKSLFEWHARHRFCSNCGHATTVFSAGWKRVCPSCAAEHFPRVDPVVIMLPLRGDRCLLGRQFAWPKGRMAPLAGFVEPGESIEEACAREVQEEAGLSARHVTYHASQPWPFPSSLMFGLFVEVEGEGIPDGVELEEVRWLTRDEARSMLDGRHPDLLAPNRYAIGQVLLTHWVEQT
jgi:NAD+ diphosphatase